MNNIELNNALNNGNLIERRHVAAFLAHINRRREVEEAARRQNEWFSFRMKNHAEKKKERKITPIPLHAFSALNIGECPICLIHMERSVVMTSCGHFFHNECLQQVKRDECPFCKKNLTE